MLRLELSEDEALLLREILESRGHEILREIHHASHREYRDMLRERERMVERLLALLQGEKVAQS